MSDRDSERLIRQYNRDDELRTTADAGVQQHARFSKLHRSNDGKQSLPMYRPSGRGNGNQLRCSRCGRTDQIRAFATMYGQGTSTAVSYKLWKGKPTNVKQYRQTEIAKVCAPPAKKSFWPAVLALILACVGGYAVSLDFMNELWSTRVIDASFLFAWLGVYLVAYRLYWNLRKLPDALNAYGRLFYCTRCGLVTRI